MQTVTIHVDLTLSRATVTSKSPTPRAGLRNWFAPIAIACIVAIWLGWAYWGAGYVTTVAMKAAQRLSATPTTAPSSKESKRNGEEADNKSEELTVAQMGQAGDLFGGLSALFAGLAFGGVAFAAYYQHRTAKDQEVQLHIAQSQHTRDLFEPLFFQLVQLFRSTQDSNYQLTEPAEWTKPANPSREEFTLALRRVVSRRWYVEGKSLSERRTDVAAEYQEFYWANESHFGPIFRTLYHIYKLIYRSGLSENQQVEYANIARGLLDRDFVFLLTLNCLTEYGRKMTPLVETYGLLKHLTDDAAIDRDLAAALLAPTATMSHAKRMNYWTTHDRPVFIVD